MTKLITFSLSLCLCFYLCMMGITDTLLASAPTAAEIIKRADELRNPSESYRMKVEVVSGSDERSVFEVSLSGNTKTLIRTLEPARDKGRNLLMINEEMWAYIPNLRRAVRVSLSQKLTGQAANGDISRMRWSGDYEAKVESENEREWQLALSAKRKGMTYDKLSVWVEKSSFRPLRAEFLTPTGKILKRATYGDYRERLGKIRPHEMTITDATRSDDRSIIRILEMEIKSFPASVFSQANLN